MNETPNEDQTSIDRFNDDGGMIVISDDETFPRGEGSKEKPYSTPIGSIDLILRNADYIRDKEGSSAINIEFQGNIYILKSGWRLTRAAGPNENLPIALEVLEAIQRVKNGKSETPEESKPKSRAEKLLALFQKLRQRN